LEVVIIGLRQTVVCKNVYPQQQHCCDINGERAGETRVVTLIVLANFYMFGEHKGFWTVSCNEQLTHMQRISTALYWSDWLTLPVLMRARAYGNCGLCGT